ncbi:MAG: PAS domain S-box protein, partial [Terriglobia bacterium]
MAQSQRELGKEVFKSLADASSNMIWVNVGGQVVYANRACLETLGYSLTEMTAQGFDVLALVAPEDRQAIADSMKAFAEGRDVPPCEVTLVTRDGGHVRVLQNTVVVLIEGERAVLGVLTDVTGLRAAERQQALLAEVSGLAAGLERAELFYSEAVSMIARQLEFPLVAIERYDREAQQMVFLAAKGHSAGKKIQRVPVSDSISGTVATAGKAVALTRADQRKDYADKELRKDNVKTFACVPISEGGQVWGVLSLGDPEERALTASLMDTLDIVASTIGALGRRLEDRERLSENRVRLEEIFKLTNDMLMLSELEAPGLPGKFVRVNDKMIDQLGYAERELLELGPPDIGEKVRLGNMGPVMKELWEEGSAISNSVFVTKDGAKIPVEISMAVVSRGEPGLFVAVARALDQGPEGVRAAEERYRALVEVQTDPLLVHKRGRILYANQAAADLFQVSSAADLLGKNVPDMIHPSDSERLRSAMESYEGTGVNSGVDDEVILRDGTKV